MSKEVITANSYRLMAMAAFAVADDSFWVFLKKYGVVELNRNRQILNRGPGRWDDCPGRNDEVAITFSYTCEREQFISDGRYYFIRSVFVRIPNHLRRKEESQHLVHQTILEGKPRDYGW